MSLLKSRHGMLESHKVHMLRTNTIRPNPGQPRQIFGPEELRELADSISQFGVLQPLTVRRLENNVYELVAGERRLRASRLAGLSEVPCILLEADEKQSSLIALVENLQRCDLDFFEEAEGLQRLIRQYGLSQEEAARRVGKSQSALANKLRILRHPPEIIDAIRRNGLTERHARALLRLEAVEDRRTVLETVVERRLNVAQTEAHIEEFITARACSPGQPEPLPVLPEPAPDSPQARLKTLYVFKDVRLFLNTINRAVDVMRQAGIHAEMDREEGEGEIVVTIRVPRGGPGGLAV